MPVALIDARMHAIAMHICMSNELLQGICKSRLQLQLTYASARTHCKCKRLKHKQCTFARAYCKSTLLMQDAIMQGLLHEQEA